MLIRAMIIIVGVGCVAACGSPSPKPVTAPTTEPTTEPTTASARPASGSSAAAPTLGLKWAVPSAAGYGQTRPATIDNGGDPTGRVSGVTWDSWGGPTAVGHGTTTYVPPGATTSQGRQERAQVVAYDLGSCQSPSGPRPAYRSVKWFFPQHGQSFTSTDNRPINACTGP